jgi:hypothetical protein
LLQSFHNFVLMHHLFLFLVLYNKEVHNSLLLHVCMGMY